MRPIYWVLFALSLVSSGAHAEDVGPRDLVEFTASTRARASEVNANFERLAEVVNSKEDETAAGAGLVTEIINGIPTVRVSGVTGSMISNESITAFDLAPNSVGSSEIQTGSIFASDLASNSVGSSEIASGAVGSSELSFPLFLGNDKVELNTLSGDLDAGFIEANHLQNDGRSALFTSETLGGQFLLTDPNGRIRVRGRGNVGSIILSNSSGLETVRGFGSTGNTYATGTKSFVHPHRTDPSLQIVYVSLEGPEAGTYFRGTARLENGELELEIPEHWQLVTQPQGITVQITPRGESMGLYVASAERERIVVREIGGGGSDVEFDYLVNGIRDGFAGHEVFQPNTVFLPKTALEGKALETGIGPALVASGILTEHGKVNGSLVLSLDKSNQAAGLRPERGQDEQSSSAATR
jgi:hypothetical protein